MKYDHTVVVIGSGFGGTMTALSVGRDIKKRRDAGDAKAKDQTVHILERGTWWTTPVGTVQDLNIRTPKHLQDNGQPVQYWPSVDHQRGLLDIFGRCMKRDSNPDGLYDITEFGVRRTGLLWRLREALFGLKRSDGLRVIHASGVGGGSLIYSNVTIRPPDFLFGTTPWQAVRWTAKERDDYYELARHAIGYGVLAALDHRANKLAPGTVAQPTQPVNTGLSNIVARSAGLRPSQPQPNQPAPPDPRTDILKLDPTKDNPFWIDRARVFQSTVGPVAEQCGTVDSSINDLPPASIPWSQIDAPVPNLAGPAAAKNYCQRMGRCTVGCLPGARHTLNKQLMRAIFGGIKNEADGHTSPPPPAPPPPAIDLENILSLTPLAEVRTIEPLPDGERGYRIHYAVRDPKNPHGEPKELTMVAEKVIVAAGCVGTVEILLRSREAGFLRHVSDALGRGFSTNGDWVAFVQDTKEQVRLIKGPVTTSYALFNRSKASFKKEDLFHTIEDNGIPPALASTLGFGLKLVEKVQAGKHSSRHVALWLMFRLAWRRFTEALRNLFRERTDRTEDYFSEDENTAHSMCITAFGHAQREGKFRLGKNGETTLRMDCVNGPSLAEDPVYDRIRTTAKILAERFTLRKDANFEDPFESAALKAIGQKSLMITHPMGGCIIGPASLTGAPPEGNERLDVFDPKRQRAGVVDEFGRVYNLQRAGPDRPFYEGLYVADAAILPTSLGVNPSLTISALALRIADNMIKEL